MDLWITPFLANVNQSTQSQSPKKERIFKSELLLISLPARSNIMMFGLGVIYNDNCIVYIIGVHSI
jgi:hypothetical protein